MKTFTILTVIAASMILLMHGAFSQEVHPDSVITGRYYNVLLSNDEWIEGKVLASDSLFIKLQQTDGTVSKFHKLNIKSVIVPSSDEVREYYDEKYTGEVEVMKLSLSLSGGLGLTSFETEGSTPSSYILNLEGILYLNRETALRLFVDCNFLRNEDKYHYYLYGVQGYSFYEKGNLALYIITADILAGSLKPEQKTRQYFTCGVGMFISSESERKYVSSGEGYSYNHTDPGESKLYPGAKLGYGIYHNINNKISLGGELLYAGVFQFRELGLISVKPKISYKISNKLGLFIEPQYTFPIVWGGHFESDGYFTVKTGITFGSF